MVADPKIANFPENPPSTKVDSNEGEAGEGRRGDHPEEFLEGVSYIQEGAMAFHTPRGH